MRTTLTIDPRLLEEVIALTGERSKSKAVSKALEEYLAYKRFDAYWALAGKIEAADNWYEQHIRHPLRLEE